MTVTHNARRLALVGIVALVASLAPLSGAQAQDTDGNALNLSGSDNVATAIAWSQVTYTPLGAEGPMTPVSEVLLGRDDLFADNLASGARQGTAAADDAGAPLLLTPSDALDADTLAEIDRVTADDATVTILGGLDAISQDVEDELTDAGYTVARLEGATRIETAIAIAEDNDDADTVLVVRAFPGDSGDDTQAFADSLGAGAVAATNGWDILFTQSDVLTGNTATALTDGAYDQAYVVGGSDAISEDVFNEVAAIVASTERVEGATRFDTAVALNELRDPAVGDGDIVLLVDGQADDAWADGFAAANLSGLNNYPVVLSNNGMIPAATEDFLAGFDTDDTTFAAHFTGVELICGATVDTETCQAALDIINGNENGTVTDFPFAAPPVDPGNETVTDRPELVSAAIGELVTAANVTPTNPIGTRVDFVFDEPVTTFDATNFYVYDADGATFYTGTDGTLSDDRTTVTVRFSTLDNAADLATVTLATNEYAAVVDDQGQESPNGDAPVGTASDTPVGAAGVTDAPDLLTVTGFRTGAAADTTAVDFTFDQDANVALPGVGGFNLILTDGTAVICDSTQTVATSGGTVGGGDGTTIITVVCPNGGINPTFTQATVARGTVDTGAVASDDGDLNPLQAADVSNSGNTTFPDLVSAVFQPGATNDAVIYQFDQAIDSTLTVPVPANFFVYDSTGLEIAGTGPATVSGNQVRVLFGPADLDDAVGASVVDGAVASNNVANDLNQEDEVGVDNTTIDSVTPGIIDAPQLATAVLAPSTGAFAAANATYSFTEDVAAGPALVPDNFELYLADGTRLLGDNCEYGTMDNEVVCDAFVLDDVASTPATNAQVEAAVLAAADYNSVVGDDSGNSNPEESEVATS